MGDVCNREVVSSFLDVKECSMADNVCQNGGTCDERLGYYICNCQLGFAGKNCTKGMADSFSINCTHMKCVFLHSEDVKHQR